MSQALTQYHALYASLASRRVKPRNHKNLDRLMVKLGVRAAARRTALGVLSEQARQVEALAPELRASSDGVIDHRIAEVREAFARGRSSPELTRAGLALVREVARRATGEEPFHVQLVGALALSHGHIVEMFTGEGKTLTGAVAACLVAWRSRRLHVFTVNDYLAARDARSRAGIYARCGLSVGAITQDTEQSERPSIYARSIVYGTPKQITADWLRDQIRMGRLGSAWAGRLALASAGASASGAIMPMIPGLRAALVDEADAVLIDEGVVPLIIAQSRREDDMARAYAQAHTLAGKLDEGPDYTIDHVQRRATLTRRGEHRCATLFDAHVATGGEVIFKAARRGMELVRQALVARHCYIRGQQYELVDGKVVIVDEYTGRFLPDRSWEHGLHQSVEAKEGLEITADRETLARMSFQRFFRSYPFLCGMTGTAADATPEFEGVFARPVTRVPTNRPLIRARWATRVFATQRDKWSAVVDSIVRVNLLGRPVLVGTRSIAASELLHDMLTRRGLTHTVLNANFDKDEADLIAHAGHGAPRAGLGDGPTGAAITVATNMAGRGTDILLDDHARANGGLHVILTEMHGASRIDRQFIGRAGRQGDPGSAQIFVSLEDELVTRHAALLAGLLRRRLGSGELRDTRIASAIFRLAQRRKEAHDRRNRLSVMRQDDWIDKHLPGA
jgi:preprotein translocase subunit SecA